MRNYTYKFKNKFQEDLPIGLKGSRHSLVDEDMSIKVLFYNFVLLLYVKKICFHINLFPRVAVVFVRQFGFYYTPKIYYA